MKIICTLKEWSQLIRGCDNNSQGGGCYKCPMTSVCGENLIENSVEVEIMPEVKADADGN